jgi:large subunit ribosomal protein L29
MKAHEVRGLPAEEIRNMMVDAENELFQLRFQHGTGQLENKLSLRAKRREIALLKTILREETMKADLAEARKILDTIGATFNVPEVNGAIKGDRLHTDKARLRKAVKRLARHPRHNEFATQVATLKNILVK